MKTGSVESGGTNRTYRPTTQFTDGIAPALSVARSAGLGYSIGSGNVVDDVACGMDLDAVTTELFARFAAQDGEGAAALCVPGARAKQNNGPDLDVVTLIAGIRARLWDAGVTNVYSDVRRTVADRAVTEQHVVTLTRPDGVEVSSDVCVVIRFDDDGLITRLDEYMDTAAFAPLFR
jgi:ketosteroid isomerase-like protein